MKTIHFGLALATAIGFAAAPATAATLKIGTMTGDSVRGAAAFAPCKACHVVQKGVNRVGPSLWGVVGRTSGSIANYKYSAANKAGHIVWSPPTLFTYLENPRKFMPGTKMSYGGLKDPQKRADVIAYLATQK